MQKVSAGIVAAARNHDGREARARSRGDEMSRKRTDEFYYLFIYQPGFEAEHRQFYRTQIHV